jgi:hypothetical protein
MPTIALDTSRLYGFRILGAGDVPLELDSRVGSKIGQPKAALDNRIGSKAGVLKAPGQGLEARLGSKIGQSKIDR